MARMSKHHLDFCINKKADPAISNLGGEFAHRVKVPTPGKSTVRVHIFREGGKMLRLGRVSFFKFCKLISGAISHLYISKIDYNSTPPNNFQYTTPGGRFNSSSSKYQLIFQMSFQFSFASAQG